MRQSLSDEPRQVVSVSGTQVVISPLNLLIRPGILIKSLHLFLLMSIVCSINLCYVGSSLRMRVLQRADWNSRVGFVLIDAHSSSFVDIIFMHVLNICAHSSLTATLVYSRFIQNAHGQLKLSPCVNTIL